MFDRVVVEMGSSEDVERDNAMPKALVIDDESALTYIVSRFLTSRGFTVQTATSGREGLGKAVADPPDVAIVDIMMPDLDGYEVCRRLRRDPRTARCAIVALTARGQQIDKGMAYQAGADLHLTKPVRSEKLVQEIQRLLADKPVGRPPLGLQIVVLRLKEGVGTTMLTTNLALCLAQESNRLTALADLVGEHGQVAERLGLSPLAVDAGIEPGDPDGLAQHLARFGKGMFVLPSLQSEQTDPVAVHTMVRTLRDWHDFVILDLPRDLGALAPALLKSSSLILLLLTPDLATLKAARPGLVAIQRLGGARGQIWPVLNLAEPGHRDLSDQVERILGLRVVAVLPHAQRECAQALANHKPVVLGHPRSPLATAIQELARQILKTTTPAREEANE